MIYWQLFLSFLQIGALSFGGGYAAMPLIESQIVTSHGWLTMTEFANLVTIAEMTPGPIAVNAATFVGTKIGGVPGALVATAGCILPVSHDEDIPRNLGLRHRAAMGITQKSDALAITVSEETGGISVAYNGKFHLNLTGEELERILTEMVA